MEGLLGLSQAFRPHVLFPVDVFHIRPHVSGALRLDGRIQSPDLMIRFFYILVADFIIYGFTEIKGLYLPIDADSAAPQPQSFKIYKSFLKGPQFPIDAGVFFHALLAPLFPEVQAFRVIFGIDGFKNIVRVLFFKCIVVVFLSVVPATLKISQIFL